MRQTLLGRRFLFVFLTLCLGLIPGIALGQPLPPPCADLSPLPHYMMGGSATLAVTLTCRMGAGLEFRFQWRDAGGILRDSTDWGASSSHPFSGALDGEKRYYRARARRLLESGEWEVGDWGDEVEVIHDLNPPLRVRLVEAAGFPTFISVAWTETYDYNGTSPIDSYFVWRDTTAAGAISKALSGAPWVYRTHDRGYPIRFRDEGCPTSVWYYAVRAKDAAGWMTSGVAVTSPGTSCDTHPDYCFPCGTPLLNPLPRFVRDSSHITVQVNLATCPRRLVCGTMYEYKMIQYAYGTSTVEGEEYFPSETGFTSDDFHGWSAGEACRTFGFTYRERSYNPDSSPFISPWAPIQRVNFDLYPPFSPTWVEATAVDVGQVEVRFNYPESYVAFCGDSVTLFRIYRTCDPTPRSELEGCLPATSPYLLHTLHRNEGTLVSGVFNYLWVDSTAPPGDCCSYTVVAFDSFGYYDSCNHNVDTACADYFVGATDMVPLPSYTCGDSVVVMIIDSTHCDASRFWLEWSTTSAFVPGTGSTWNTGWLDIHGAYNPEDRDCRDIDTIRYVVKPLDESNWCFRAKFIDHLNNEGVWGPTICTNLDQSPPPAIMIDSIRSTASPCATDAGKIDVHIYWSPVFDAGSGTRTYFVERSGDAGTTWATIFTIPVDAGVTEYTDSRNDPGTSYYHQYYYRVIAEDACGRRRTNSIPIFFWPNTPPRPPVINYINFTTYRDSVIIEWRDTIWVAGVHEVQYTANPALFCRGGGSYFIKGETVIGSNQLRLPSDSVFSLGSTIYFRVKALDAHNESGWSAVQSIAYPFVPEDTLTMTLYAGWNLISVPVEPIPQEIASLFPTALSIWWYNACSQTNERCDPSYVVHRGQAYWVQVLRDATVTIVGMDVERAIHPVCNGWNQVGSITVPIAIADQICWTPGATPRGSYYRYDATVDHYVAEDETLYPGVGYWILAAVSGLDESVILGGGCTPRAAMPAPTCDPDWTARVSFTARDGSAFIDLGQALQAGLGYNPGADIFLPPTAPSGWDAVLVREGLEWGLAKEMIGRDDRSSWNLRFNGLEAGEVVTVTGLGDALLALYAPDGSLLLTKDGAIEVMPGTYRLEAISPAASGEFAMTEPVPNPLTDETRFLITLPEACPTEVVIRDMVGRPVVTLSSGVLEEGRHLFTWHGRDGTGQPIREGVYLLSATCGERNLVRRLTVLR